MKHEIGEFVPIHVDVRVDEIVIEDELRGIVLLTLSEAKRLRDILNEIEL